MKDQFVTYDIALKLKKLGFNENCFAKINYRDDLVFCTDKLISNQFLHLSFAVPLWQQVVDWLNEKGIYISYSKSNCNDKPIYTITYYCEFRNRLNDLFESDKETAFLQAINLVKK